ncbi:hypothetical protein OG730_00775 [Streptomyces sp. NBC_01298]|uniref:hypothetical protein n=1 Tax=Streptomyces sp. NBC_01298 TaxID=2903817 RepID=UPI002E15515F|nr:hypothetical protein OG730_00775 [Streptomyces sp. NBC_01298]
MARSLPRRREHVTDDLGGRGLARTRVLARLTRLLDLGSLRIGGERYARDNGSHGLTTLLREHASCRSGEIRLAFPAKSGRTVPRTLIDEQAPAVVSALLRRKDPGTPLVSVTAKDFRTWYANVLAAVAWPFPRTPPTPPPPGVPRSWPAPCARSASASGTRRPCAVPSYIDPRVIELNEGGDTIAPALGRLGEDGLFGWPSAHGGVERAVLELLRPGRS